MNDRTFLSVFTPSRTAPEDLEAIFVQRQAMLDDAVERVRESATTGNKHHLLFVGPRGTGKTHLVTLLVHRLGQDEELKKHLNIAWLNEDATSTTLLEFLRRIYLALVKRYPDDYSEASLEPIYDLEPDAAEHWLANLLLEQLKDRTLLVVMENLDALFEGLGEPGQQRLRALIQEHPVLTIVATAQRLVDDITKRNSVFFGFFQTEQLVTLSVEEAAELLGKIATLNGQPDVAAFLHSPTGRARIRALHHLSGGNHRIYIVLSQFITRDNIDALVGPFSKMMDEMTPYYQERIRWLPAQQRKIVEYLCTRERPTPVKELAKRLFASHQTISSQLKDLRDKGYVQSAQRGRESLYEIAEPLMRICVEVKENQTSEPMRLLVDFLRVWYDSRDLTARLQGCDRGSIARAYLQAAMEKNSELGDLRAQLLVEGFRTELGDEQSERWLSRIESYAQQSEELALACGEWAKGNKDQALSLLAEIADESGGRSASVRASACLLAAEIYFTEGEFARAIEALNPIFGMSDAPVEQVGKALNNRGWTYGQLGESEKALADYSAVIALPNAPVEQVAKALLNRGVTYGQLGESEKALADYSAVIALPNAPAEQVAMALEGRGLTYELLGESEKALADYSAVIVLPNAPVESIARALLNRGWTYGQLGESEKALADYCAVIALPNAPVEPVAMALVNRGWTYWHVNDTKHSEQDFEKVLGLIEAPIALRVAAHFALATICIATGRWDSGVSVLAGGLALGTTEEQPYLSDSVDIIAVFFESTLTPSIRRERTSELVQVYQDHNAILQLGEALTSHLGRLYRTGEDLPASDSLELWASAWEEAGRDIDAFRVPLRIFRTGVDFLKAGGKDRTILLDLNQEERRILEQALKLEAEP
jgi:tetratricopeptide (TPR) repeat protein